MGKRAALVAIDAEIDRVSQEIDEILETVTDENGNYISEPEEEEIHLGGVRDGLRQARLLIVKHVEPDGMGK